MIGDLHCHTRCLLYTSDVYKRQLRKRETISCSFKNLYLLPPNAVRVGPSPSFALNFIAGRQPACENLP